MSGVSIRRLIWFPCAVASMSLMLVGCPPKGPGETPTPAPPKKKLSVAGNLPLTGPIAAFCGQYPNGFRMGLEAEGLNDKGASVDFQDNTGDPATAVTVLQKHGVSDPDIYVSGTTQMSEAILPQLSKKKSLHFLVSFDAFMTHGAPNIYRILPNFKIEAPLFVRYIKHKKAKRVFFFTPNLKAYLEQSDRLILPELDKAKIEHQRELFEFKHKDYRSIAEKADSYKPDVIVVSGYSFHVLPILRALREFGLTERSSVICTLDYIDLLYNDTPNEVLKGIAFTSPHCEIPGKVPGYADWREKYSQQFKKQPSYVDAYAYDTARILAAAHKASGAVDDASLRATLPFEGVVGRIQLDPEGDLESTLTIGLMTTSGSIEEVTTP